MSERGSEQRRESPAVARPLPRSVAEIAEAARQAAATTLALGPVASQLGRVADEALATADERADAASRAWAPHFATACKEGCCWCCHLSVVASPPEVLRIADFLRSTLSPEQLVAVTQRVAALDADTRGLTPLQRLQLRRPCALLVDGRCSVYPVRPFGCRGWTADDARKCEAVLQQPLVPVGLNRVRAQTADAVRAGVQQALAEAGLADAALELTAGLRVALELPDAAERYAANEPIFAGATAALHAGGTFENKKPSPSATVG